MYPTQHGKILLYGDRKNVPLWLQAGKTAMKTAVIIIIGGMGEGRQQS